MKKYLLGIILFVAGFILMSVGVFMQFAMTPKTTNTTTDGNDTTSIEENIESEDLDLQDISSFDFSPITGAVFTGQVGGYLVACSNDVSVPTQVSVLSMNSVLETVNTAKGYRISDNSISTCAPASFVIGTLAGTDFATKMLEVEPLDTNTLLLVYEDITYEFVFGEDISTLFGNLS